MVADKGFYLQQSIVKQCPSVDKAVVLRCSLATDGSIDIVVEQCQSGYFIGPNGDTCERTECDFLSFLGVCAHVRSYVCSCTGASLNELMEL